MTPKIEEENLLWNTVLLGFAIMALILNKLDPVIFILCTLMAIGVADDLFRYYKRWHKVHG